VILRITEFRDISEDLEETNCEDDAIADNTSIEIIAILAIYDISIARADQEQ
jgi:hypothetical protein